MCYGVVMGVEGVVMVHFGDKCVAKSQTLRIKERAGVCDELR